MRSVFSDARVIGEYKFQFISPSAGGETLLRAFYMQEHSLSCVNFYFDCFAARPDWDGPFSFSGGT